MPLPSCYGPRPQEKPNVSALQKTVEGPSARAQSSWRIEEDQSWWKPLVFSRGAFLTTDTYRDLILTRHNYGVTGSASSVPRSRAILIIPTRASGTRPGKNSNDGVPSDFSSFQFL